MGAVGAASRRISAAALLLAVVSPLVLLAEAQDAVDPGEGMQGLMAQLHKKIAEQQKEAGHPYVDADKDGKLTTEEVRTQWSSWMDGAMQAGRALSDKFARYTLQVASQQAASDTPQASRTSCS